MNAVESHLLDCAECRSELEQARKLSMQLNNDPHMQQALNQLDAAQPFMLAQLSTRLSRPARRPVRMFATAAALLTAVAVTAFLLGQRSQPLQYETMTDAPSVHGPVVQVMFSASFTEVELRQLLADSGGQLLGSPSRKGVYRIVLPVDRDSVRYAARLRNHPGVRWAESEQ